MNKQARPQPVEAKYTLAPWSVRFHKQINCFFIHSGNDQDVAEAPVQYILAGRVRGENYDDFAEVDANAALMATAPRLLKALQAIIGACDRCELSDDVSLIDEFTEEMENEAREAIAQALDYKAISALRKSL